MQNCPQASLLSPRPLASASAAVYPTKPKTGGTLMRAQLLAFTFLATAIAPLALAQPAGPPPMKTFTSSSEVIGLIAKAKADRKGDAPLTAEPILSLAPYRAQLEYRTAVSPAAVPAKDS